MKRIAALTLCALLAATLCIGCTQSAAGDDEESSVVILSDPWDGIDIYQLDGTVPFMTLVGQPMFFLDEKGEMNPTLVDEWSISEDGMDITIKLLDGMKFYDGTPVVAEDVCASILHGADVCPYAEDFAAISDVEAVDDLTFVIHMSEYSSTVLYYLSNVYFVIISHECLETMSNEELLWGAKSYGPYYVEEYAEGSHITLKKNENYICRSELVENQGACSVDKVTVKFINDAFTVAESLMNGEADLSYVSFEYLDDLNASENLTLANQYVPCVTRLLFNNNGGTLLDDANVRKALIKLLDRSQIASYSFGQYSEAYAYIIEGMSDYEPAVEEYCKTNYGFDPEGGLALMAEAGWTDSDGDGYLDKNGEKLTINLWTPDYCKSVAEIVQILYKEQGVDVVISEYEESVILDAYADNSYEAALNNFWWGDSASTLPYIVDDEDAIDYDTYYSNAFAYAAIADDTERTAKFAELQHVLMDGLYNYPIAKTSTVIAYNKEKLSGIVLGAEGYLLINDVG